MRIRMIVCLLLVWAQAAAGLETSVGTLKLQTMAEGLDTPWSFGFLPDGNVLITERDGRLMRLAGETLTEVRGVPKVRTGGQGGLLDVLVPRNFAKSRQLYFTYSKRVSGGANTALARAVLSPNGKRLRGWAVIFEARSGFSGGRHFGSRIVEARDGTLFVTLGDRGDRPSAQDLANTNGSVIRVTRNGEVPVDNPFADVPNARSEIWSYGHRNPQGAALDAKGRLWVVEHGAKGGDEVNLIRRGANYGWPVIAYGEHYSGGKIGEGTQKRGMAQPEHYWDPSIAPSGMMIYSGKLWPQWRGHIFTGSLKFDYIARLAGRPLTEVEQLKSPDTLRVRDIREAPDGSIWFLSEGQGVLYRLAP